MPLSCLPVVMAMLLFTVNPGRAHSTKTGGPSLSARGAPSTDCSSPAPALSPSLALQYRAALLYLHAEGVRRVLVLRRPGGQCAVSADLLRSAGLRPLGAPLVLERADDWARLDLRSKQAGEDVAVLAQDEGLLAEALARHQASRWADAVWYAPEMERGGARLEKTGRVHKFKVLTSVIVDGSKRNWTFPREDNTSATTQEDPILRTVNTSAINTNNEGSTGRTAPDTSPPLGRSSVLLLRWAGALGSPEDTLSAAGSPLIQVLRSSPWLLAGVYHSGRTDVEPPAALIVQRSALRTRLATAGCATWRAELSGEDPLSGAPLSRLYTESSLPAVAALQGPGPLTVRVQCPQLSATLDCTLQLERTDCHWDSESSGRSRRETRGSPPQQHAVAHWQPGQWRPITGRRNGRQQGEEGAQRPAEAPREQRVIPREPREQPSQWRAVSSQERSTVGQRQTPSQPQPPRQYRAESASQLSQNTHPDSHRTGPFGSPFSTADQGHSVDQHHQVRSDAAHLGISANEAYATNAINGGYLPDIYRPEADQRVQLLPPGTDAEARAELWLAVFPSISSCGGAIAGCLTCITLLQVLNTAVSPFACVGPCSIGGGTACSGAAGTVYREVKKIQQAESRRGFRRRFSARSQRRLGRLGARWRSARHL